MRLAIDGAPAGAVLEQTEIISRAVYNSVNENCSLFDNIENQIVLDDKITVTEIKQRGIIRDSTEIRVGSKQSQAVFDFFEQAIRQRPAFRPRCR